MKRSTSKTLFRNILASQEKINILHDIFIQRQTDRQTDRQRGKRDREREERQRETGRTDRQSDRHRDRESTQFLWSENVF